jgi:hypothetical protein
VVEYTWHMATEIKVESKLQKRDLSAKIHMYTFHNKTETQLKTDADASTQDAWFDAENHMVR